MLSGETIICFAPDPWVGLWRNRHQIMTRLARRNTVIYVEPRAYLGETVRRARGGQIGWSDLNAPRLHRERDGLYLYKDPVYAPHAGPRSGGMISAAVRRAALRRAIASVGGAAPILWLLRPWDADQIGHYREKLVVYHVTDEYGDHPAITDKAQFKASEEALLRRADLVIVTSAALLASKSPYSPATHLVRNAVDYEGFQATLGGGRTLPWLESLPRPRVGYAGALNEKIDYALLEGLAQARAGWQLILAGGLNLMLHPAEADGLLRLPNVHWPGRLPVDEVPLVIGGMDACLLPYKLNSWTANIDSLKLYEYLACGKPVIATDIPAAREFASVVCVVENAPEPFVRAIEAELAADSEALRVARRAAVSDHTWDERVAAIERLLGERLAHA